MKTRAIARAAPGWSRGFRFWSLGWGGQCRKNHQPVVGFTLHQDRNEVAHAVVEPRVHVLDRPAHGLQRDLREPLDQSWPHPLERLALIDRDHRTKTLEPGKSVKFTAASNNPPYATHA